MIPSKYKSFSRTDAIRVPREVAKDIEDLCWVLDDYNFNQKENEDFLKEKSVNEILFYLTEFVKKKIPQRNKTPD